MEFALVEFALVEFALVDFALVEFALVGAAPGRDLWCLSRAGRAPTHAGSFALVGAAPGRDLGCLSRAGRAPTRDTATCVPKEKQNSRMGNRQPCRPSPLGLGS